MNFIGTGARLAPDDFARAAHMLGCKEAAVRAVVAVEARGQGFDNRNRPVILFEPHVFYRCTSGEARAAAVRDGLAWRKWRPGAYPATSEERYQQLARAMRIDASAALKACSWGLGQVLGENHVAAGFANVEAMVAACLEGEGRQLDCMVAFIISNKLDGFMRSENWIGFARGYNGPAYQIHSYDVKLAQAFRKAELGAATDADPLADGMLSIGDKGEAVKVLQIELQAEGLRVLADGDFGPMTAQAVEAFQKRRLLTVDGKVGPKTGAALGLRFWD
jgi:hypothetical protein